LACHQYLHAGGLDVVDMHKNIGAAAIGSDKAISAICVEEFDPPTWHCSFNPIQRTANAPTRLTGRSLAQRAAPSALAERAGHANTNAIPGLPAMSSIVMRLPSAVVERPPA